MKLKYYLRGLGIGIFVTAIIMGVAFQNKKPMTDEEIKARAKELGMIENSVIADLADKEELIEDVSGDEQEGIDTNVKEPDTTQETEQETNQETNQENETDKEPVKETEKQPEEDSEADKEPPKEENQNKGTITITVGSGDSSWTVSKRMEEAGLIESAKDFDTHLCRYGYDKKISVGSYKIPVTATHEEMAKILTKQK